VGIYLPFERQDQLSKCEVKDEFAEIWSKTAKTPRGTGECRRSAEIHSGEVQRARVSSAQAPGSQQRDVLSRCLHDPHPVGPKAKLFCVISVTLIIEAIHTNIKHSRKH